MNMLRRAQGAFAAERDKAVAALRQARVVASDETGVRIEGCNAYHWVFRCSEAVVCQRALNLPQIWAFNFPDLTSGVGSGDQPVG